MGAAISRFEGAKAVRVPRTRFFPVKSTNDLLALRSSRILLDPDKGFCPSQFTDHSSQVPPSVAKLLRRTGTVFIELDPRYYKHLDDFEERFDQGAPDLSDCSSLKIKGNVFFNKNVTIRGNVTITTSGPEQCTIPSGTVIDSNLKL